MFVYTIQPVVMPVVNGLYRVYKHLTGCQTRLTTGLTTGCIVYTAARVVKPVVKNRLSNRFDNRFDNGWMFVYTIQPVVNPVVQPFDNRLYRVNGVLANVNCSLYAIARPSVVCLSRSCTLLRRLKFSAIFLRHLVPWPPVDIPEYFYRDRPGDSLGRSP